MAASADGTINMPKLIDSEKVILMASLIREFEVAVLDRFDAGLFRGTVHTCIGQELAQATIIGNIGRNDTIVSNHRNHGHYIAFTGDIRGLYDEISGLESGVSGGVGGSQHIHSRNFYSSGVQGNMIPVAAGMAYAQKIKGCDSIVVCFIGDGTLGQGVLYETLNIASLWGIPMLLIVENNRYAQSTSIADNMSGTVEGRAAAFDIVYDSWDGEDYNVLDEKASSAVKFVKEYSRPMILEVSVDRIAPHSKGQDYRSKDEMQQMSSNDWYNGVSDDMKLYSKNRMALLCGM